MTMLADFAAMGFRQQKQQARMIAQERAAAAARMANALAHQINNPLQSITNLAYLVAEGIDLGRAGDEDVLKGRGLVDAVVGGVQHHVERRQGAPDGDARAEGILV